MKILKTTLTLSAAAAAVLVLCQCAAPGGDPVGDTVGDFGEAIEDTLPGLGPGQSWENDPVISGGN